MTSQYILSAQVSLHLELVSFRDQLMFLSGLPSLYLRPPPSGEDNTYIVEDGRELDIDCRTERTIPSPTTVGYRAGSGAQHFVIFPTLIVLH